MSTDEAVQVLLFEHRTRTAFARLGADPQAPQEYRDEARALAEADVEVTG